MSKTTRKAVDTWDLNEFLAMLRQVTRDNGSAERAPQKEAEDRLLIAHGLSAGDQSEAAGT